MTGKAATPTTILITQDGVSFEDATLLWGLDTHDTQKAFNLEKKRGFVIGRRVKTLSPMRISCLVNVFWARWSGGP
jgi:aldehyde:ferredoxin oxidoreductase